jgi:hypothetical protein
MHQDEATARIELGLYRLAHPTNDGFIQQEPLAIYTPKRLAALLAVPERYLIPLLPVVVETQPRLHMRAQRLQGGNWRLDFGVTPTTGNQPQLATLGWTGVDLAFPPFPSGSPEVSALLGSPALLAQYLDREAMAIGVNPWANVLVDSPPTSEVPPEPARPTGWQRISKDEEE